MVVAVTRILEISVGDCLEAASRIKLRGDLMGECLIVDKSAPAGRTDGLFVQLNGIESPPFEARDLRTDQRGTVLEILGARFRPHCQPLVVSRESLKML